jgi:hypothetical protein
MDGLETVQIAEQIRKSGQGHAEAAHMNTDANYCLMKTSTRRTDPLAGFSLQGSHAVHKDRIREKDFSLESREAAPALSTKNAERTGHGRVV